MRDDIAEKFSAVMRLLGDEGIGGDRTVGSGNFCPRFSDAVPDFCQPQKSQWFVNLSPLFPKPEETPVLFADGCNYRLTVRSGWMGGVLPSSVQRKTVRMIGEGSVLCGSADQIWGAVANVTPNGTNHPVYRWGLRFPYRMQGESVMTQALVRTQTFTVTFLSPVHIGTEERLGEHDFVYENGRLIRFRSRTFRLIDTKARVSRPGFEFSSLAPEVTGELSAIF